MTVKACWKCAASFVPKTVGIIGTYLRHKAAPQIAQISRYAYLTRVELDGWVAGAPASDAAQLVKWATTWLLRGVPWHPQIAELVAKEAVILWLRENADSVGTIDAARAEYGVLQGQYGQRNDPFEEWAEMIDFLWPHAVGVDHLRRAHLARRMQEVT